MFTPQGLKGALYHRGRGESASGTETSREHFPLLPSQRVQVGEEIVELLLGEGVADGRHHVAAGEDGLAHESFVGGQPAGQKWFLEKALEAGPVLSRDGMRVVAGCTVLLIQMPTGSLLSVQSQLCVGFPGGVVAAPGEESQENEAGENWSSHQGQSYSEMSGTGHCVRSTAF